MKEDSAVFLVKPYDHILIRQNPIYREPVFVFERLDKDLSISKEELTSKHLPEARCPEEFLVGALEHPHMKQNAKTSLRYAKRPGWVRIIAPRNISIEDLWKIAMQKIGNKELYTIKD